MGRLESWPHLGTFSDVLKLRADDDDYGSFRRVVRCPVCRKMSHPNVTSDSQPQRRGESLFYGGRHCNYCQVRWDDDTPGSTWATCGRPERVVASLLSMLSKDGDA